MDPFGADVYVYYRVTGDLAAARVAAADLMHQIQQQTGAGGRLLVRCNDPSTWLEVYGPVHDVTAFVDALDRLATGHALAHHVADRRHVECFRTPEPLGGT